MSTSQRYFSQMRLYNMKPHLIASSPRFGRKSKNDQSYEIASPYGFEVDWDQDEEDQSDDPDIHSAAVVKLMKSIGDHRVHEDQIEKFCLPILRSANSDCAVDHVLSK